MRNLNQAYAGLNTLGHRIEDFLKNSNHYNYSDRSNFDYDGVELDSLTLRIRKGV